MDSERWDRMQELFHAALGLAAQDRDTYLVSSCGRDRLLLDEVRAMVTADDTGGSLLDRGLPEIAYEMVGEPENWQPPEMFGSYRRIRILGQGGMGVVWLADRADYRTQVAIKFLLHAELSPARRERFVQEIRTLAKLTHPFVARLYDAGTLPDGAAWFAMEYVEGVRLTEYCRQPGRSLDEQLLLFRVVCEAVQYAHGQEIIHRDLKPSNILVQTDGTPKLLDFGIARELQQVGENSGHTVAGPRFMSRDYAAPEWVRDGVVGFSTDVYSLGVMLYEILSGRHPFRSEDEDLETAELPKAKEVTQVERPSLAGRSLAGISRAEWGELDLMCLKAMHRDRMQRYGSVEALIRDLDHFLKKEPLEARPDSLSYRARKFVERNRAAVVAAAIVCTIVVAMIVVFTVRLAKARDAALTEAARAERIQRFMLSLFQGDDPEAGPAADLRVVTLLDRGVQGAQSLSNEPAAQADLYETLGLLYQKQGKLDKADAMLQAGNRVRDGLPAAASSSVGEGQFALALLRSEQGRSQEAEQLARRSLATALVGVGPKERLEARADFTVGKVLVAAGKYAPSVEFLNRAVLLQSKGGQSSPELAESLSILADARMYLGDYGESESLNQRALAINRRIYGDTHPMVSESLRNLGEDEEMWGHYALAEQYERQALTMDSGWYGTVHPMTANAMTTLSQTLVLEAKYPEAMEMLHQALTIQESVYGKEHVKVAYVLNAQGMLALQLRAFPEAEGDFRRMIEIYRSALGDGNYKVAIGIANLASVYCAEKRYPECEVMLKDALSRLRKALPAENINIGIEQMKLGRTLLHESKFAEAEGHTLAGYAILSKQMGAQSSYVRGARHDLAVIYDALHEPEKALPFRDALLATK